MGFVKRTVEALYIEDKCLVHEACWNLSRNQAAFDEPKDNGLMVNVPFVSTSTHIGLPG
jgi:hypothetical protein